MDSILWSVSVDVFIGLIKYKSGSEGYIDVDDGC